MALKLMWVAECDQCPAHDTEEADEDNVTNAEQVLLNLGWHYTDNEQFLCPKCWE